LERGAIEGAMVECPEADADALVFHVFLLSKRWEGER
ncbi:MAG: hypothetical protein ACI9MB_003524, partial [Verrucomicrobiales bacterium]